MPRGEKLRIQKTYGFFEGRVVQKRAGSKIDVLLFEPIDYACLVEAVSLYEHQSRRGGILDGKDYFDVPCTLHEWVTGSSQTSSLEKSQPNCSEPFNR
jgi:hypothetical protein